MTKADRRPSGSNIFALSLRTECFVTESERARLMSSMKLGTRLICCLIQFQLMLRTLIELLSCWSLEPNVALTYHSSSCVNSASFEIEGSVRDFSAELIASSNTLLFEFHFRRLKPLRYISRKKSSRFLHPS